MTKSYDILTEKVAAAQQIDTAREVLCWDRRFFMPKDSLTRRVAEEGMLGKASRMIRTDPQMDALVRAAEQENLSDWQRKNLEFIKENMADARLVPQKLHQQIMENQIICQSAYGKAKAENKWEIVSPSFANLLAAEKQKAQIFADAKGHSLYDHELKRYSGDSSTALLDPFFARIDTELPGIAEAILKKQPQKPKLMPIEAEHQMAVTKDAARKMNFDFRRGRIDIGPTASCGGSSQDTRIITRFDEGTLTTISSGLHETGHGIHRQYVPKEWSDQPIGRSNDLALNEGLAIIWERQLGYSEPMLRYLHGQIDSVKPEFTARHDLQNFTAHMRHVGYGHVRIMADEVTYPLHISLRYQIEKNLFDGSLDIDDIPHIWAEKTKELLHMDAAEPCKMYLQDPHWFKGKFGYFPTYAVGNIYAAQLFDSVQKDITDFPGQIEKGHLSVMTDWLDEKVFSLGKSVDTPELIERATGKKPDVAYFLDHLKKRYL